MNPPVRGRAYQAGVAACGAQGIFRDHPLNHAWLDIKAGRTHVANNLSNFGRILGGTMLGAENRDFFLWRDEAGL